MKKLIYILVALLAFLCGIFVFFIRPLFITVPLYELKGNVQYYKYQKIKVKGYFTPTKDESSYFYSLEDYTNKCSGEFIDCASFVSLELSEGVEKKENLLIEEIAEKNYQLGKTEFRRGFYGAEVEVIGYVEERNGVFGLAPVIKIEEIKQISPIKFISTVRMTETN